MSVFEDYAQFYDSLYKDKDYDGECDYLEEVFKTHSKSAVKTILNLGCGTGNHDEIMLERGYQITGVDMSSEMLEIAKNKLSKFGDQIELIENDIRNLDLSKKFDAVISMFAVMGYMVTNNDLENALKTFAINLKPGGIGIFDVWFGPAVLIDPPQVVSKTVEEDNQIILRKTTPELDVIKQTVTVNFETKVTLKNGDTRVNNESHNMRFFFYQELDYFFKKAGLQTLGMHPFLKLDGLPSTDSWNMSVILKKP